MQIPDSSRFLVGQYVTVHDDVISHVNITNVKNEDGGEYTCTAQNSIGKYVGFLPLLSSFSFFACYLIN